MKNPTVVFPKAREVAVEDRPIPEPKQGEVRIKTIRSLISTGTELTILSGEFPRDSFWAGYGKYPFVAGYSNFGVVEALGPGVDKSWMGKRVSSFTQHAAFVTCGVGGLNPVPDEVPDEQAPFFSLALIVMNGVRRAQLQWGESVVLYGLGLLGQFAARFCHLSGARPVIGMDLAPARLELFPKGSGYVSVDTSKGDPAAKVKELTKGRMADVVFEITGNQNLIPGEFAFLKKQGRFVVLSSPRGPSSFDFHDLVNAPSTTIIGAHQMSHPDYETPFNVWTKNRNVEFFFELVRSGEFDLKPLISHRVSALKGDQAYRDLLADRSKAMGVILEWGA